MDFKRSSLQPNLEEPADCINVKITKMLAPSYSKVNDFIQKDSKIKVVRDLNKTKTMVDQKGAQNKVNFRVYFR